MCMFNVERWASAGQAYREPGADLRNPARPREELPRSRDAVCAQGGPTASEDGAARAAGEGPSCHVRTGRLRLRQGLGEGKFERSASCQGFALFLSIWRIEYTCGEAVGGESGFRRGGDGCAKGRRLGPHGPGLTPAAAASSPTPLLPCPRAHGGPLRGSQQATPRSWEPALHPRPHWAQAGPSLPCASGPLPPGLPSVRSGGDAATC